MRLILILILILFVEVTAEPYSPPMRQDYPDKRYWGDTHAHIVGSTVDVESATYVNSIGDHSLSTTWTDPDFDREEAAFYYMRVLQIPTPRWQIYETSFNGVKERPKPTSIQERAYSSPIWYTP